MRRIIKNNFSGFDSTSIFVVISLIVLFVVIVLSLLLLIKRVYGDFL